MNTNAFPDRMRWYLLPALAIYLAGLSAYALWSDIRTKQLILEDINQRLLVAARALPYILPPDFHDRAVAPEAIEPEEELALRAAVSGFASDSGFVYVYTLVPWQDGFYFSAPTVTEEEALERESWYFYPYEDIPREFVRALKGADPVYVSYSDQWGTFRSVALPLSSPEGRPYLACADLDIGHVQDLVRRNTLVTVGTACFFIVLTLPIVIAFRAMWMGHYSRLNAVNHELRQAQSRRDQILASLEDEREKLSDSRRNYRLLVDHVASAIVRLDRRCRVTFFNEYARTLLGLNEETILGRDFAATILENAGLQGRDMAGALASLLEGSLTTAQHETRHKLTHGKVGWIHWSCRAVTGEDPEDASILCVGQDVTTRKRLEADLVRALDEAQAASRAKGIFLANMSHEIRTPLNALLGYTQLLARDDGLTESQKEQITIIESSGNHLLTLINDILEMSRIEAGKVPIVSTDFEFRPLMNEIGAMFRAAARARGLELDINVADGMPAAIYADPTRIRQVVINLVGNALKYTVSGGVTVRCEFTAQNRSQGPGQVTITVRDTGPGIPEGSLSRAMKAFERISEHECCPMGSGLGLFISREYARLMGGDLVLENAPGGGVLATFSFRATGLDRSSAKAKEQIVTGVRRDGPPPVILVTDDISLNRDLLRDIFEDIGCEVLEAADGQEALDIFRERKPDAVLMDRRMPGMSGMEAIRRIRELPGGQETVIVMVTASAFEECRNEAALAGADGFIRKPFKIAELLDELGRLMKIEFVDDKA